MKETLFFDGKDYFEALINAIDQARSSIFLESYIFNFDEIGKLVIRALLRAAARQVKVKVLIDGLGSCDSANKIIEVLSPSCKVRIYHPLPWKLRHFLYAYPSVLLHSFFNINVRNHRKLVIIDQKLLFTGSFNITKEHVDDVNCIGWRDTGICLDSFDLTKLNQACNSAWKNINYTETIRSFFRAVKNNLCVRINNTWYRRRILHRDLLNKIKQAKNRIWITNAYFVPDSALLKQLIGAAKRGVDVKILLPSRSDIAFMPWTSQTFYRKLLIVNTKIFEYLPAILHAKTLIIDDWMTIGSSNLNHRSLLHDLELDIVVQTDKAKEMLVMQFKKDIENAKVVQIEDLDKRTWYQKLIGEFLLHLRYLM